MSETTFWNGEPCEARKVRVIVGDRGNFPVAWFHPYIGQEREAVEVRWGGGVMYLDNEDGSGWHKVTGGHGSPRWIHRNLDVERVLDAPMEVEEIGSPPDAQLP